MSQRHEERYKRAIARTTPERREKILARVLRELGMVKYPTEVSAIVRVDALVAMKLGERHERL